MPQITLPDGNKLDFPAPAALKEIAAKIGSRLAKAALAGEVDGQLKDLDHVVTQDAAVRFLTPDQPEGLKLMRHSAAHVLAEAVCKLFPGTKLAYGPAIEDGFYYDVDSPTPITAADLPKLEKEIQRIVKANAPFKRQELSRAEAEAKYKDDPYKLDNIARAEGDVISFYLSGEFSDLCRGPHVPSTGKVGKIKVLSLAGAYWHGDQTKPQLTRIYGTAFPTQEELDAHLRRVEEAKQRDHRKLGRELGLFEFHPEAPGQAFWRHNGVVLFNTAVDYLRRLCYRNGYEEFRTPTVLDKSLWVRSGHWANYADKMYITTKDEREFGVKPMNCPGGVILYKAGLYSHNDLPLRWAEFGYVHRHESGGEIHGLVRVRGFTQDDAHVFCTPAQLQAEVGGCLRLIFEVYRTFGLSFHHIELSTRPEKSIGTTEMWDAAEAALRGALDDEKIEYRVNPGDGAFYGPKIDFHVSDAIGRTWQLGTVQVDFAMPENFDLQYVAADGSRQRPVMIHRAISGSLERFIGILTEHYAGAFPLWLAPEQIRLLTITDAQLPFAEEVLAALRAADIRAGLDRRGERIGAKIRAGEMQKVPYLAVIGEKEAAGRTVALRKRGAGDLGACAVADLVTRLQGEIAARTITTETAPEQK